jgi:hypothetical protein
MLTINIAEKYNFRKLYQPHFVNELTERMKKEKILGDSKSIELNIQSCRVGYPGTPQFIDYFLDHLSKQQGDKEFTIKMGCISYSEWVCLNIIVLDGTFFEVKNKMASEMDLAQNKTKIEEKLKTHKIVLRIILGEDKNIEFKYGYNE